MSSRNEGVDRAGRRLEHGITRGRPFHIFFNGRAVAAHEGETIAGALFAAGERVLRRSPHSAPRGVYCGIGICYECVVQIEGRGRERACTTLVRPEMQVASLDRFDPSRSASEC
jgi:predicted molibdopterin-dependent oxidoreductase YjgC